MCFFNFNFKSSIIEVEKYGIFDFKAKRFGFFLLKAHRAGVVEHGEECLLQLGALLLCQSAAFLPLFVFLFANGTALGASANEGDQGGEDEFPEN